MFMRELGGEASVSGAERWIWALGRRKGSLGSAELGYQPTPVNLRPVIPTVVQQWPGEISR